MSGRPVLAGLLAGALAACATAPVAPAPDKVAATGTVESWGPMASRYVAARRVDVWLPPSYAGHPERRYPVLYMHDGQNLFDPALAYTGVDWDVDGALTRLAAAGEVREAIVVGVWNTAERTLEYAPAKALTAAEVASGVPGRAPIRTSEVKSDAYLRFLVDELKPFIDGQYRSLAGPDDTVVMGSSMGGLISLYALAEYPGVFGAAGALSTHWPAGDGAMVTWLAANLPPPGEHRVYFDYGTATLDATYGAYQQAMDARMQALGYRAGQDWLTRRFDGAEHNEAAWRARVHEPLVFLLGPPRD
ncbi:MAG: alpha/beta hydrolase [Arenimonas sp.]|nr:alpha/beta hydrolase [Arenimonas sp.]